MPSRKAMRVARKTVLAPYETVSVIQTTMAKARTANIGWPAAGRPSPSGRSEFTPLVHCRQGRMDWSTAQLD